MAHRNIMRIELPGPAKQKFATLSDRHGMTQVAMLSRLVEWFAKQGPDVQTNVVSGKSARETTTKILKKMAR